MLERRRRILYVDKIFQKKLLLVFLGWNVVVIIANFSFYYFNLRSRVEENLFRSHIQIANLSEVFSEKIIRFNLILAGISIVVIFIFYLIIRSRITSFFNDINGAIQSRMLNKFDGSQRVPVLVSEEFANIDQIVQDFFKEIDSRLAKDQERVSFLKEFIAQKKQTNKSGKI